MARFWPKWRYNGRVMAREVSFYQCLWVTKFCAKFGCSRTPRTASVHNSFIVLRCMWKEPAPFKSATTITTSTTDILRSTELLSSTARVVKVSITSEIHMRLKNCFLHTFISYQYLGDLPCVEALTDSAHNTAYWASNANTRSKLFLKSFTTPTSRKWGRSSNNIRNKNLTLPRKFKGCAPKLRKAKWE